MFFLFSRTRDENTRCLELRCGPLQPPFFFNLCLCSLRVLSRLRTSNRLHCGCHGWGHRDAVPSPMPGARDTLEAISGAEPTVSPIPEGSCHRSKPGQPSVIFSEAQVVAWKRGRHDTGCSGHGPSPPPMDQPRLFGTAPMLRWHVSMAGSKKRVSGPICCSTPNSMRPCLSKYGSCHRAGAGVGSTGDPKAFVWCGLCPGH